MIARLTSLYDREVPNPVCEGRTPPTIQMPSDMVHALERELQKKRRFCFRRLA